MDQLPKQVSFIILISVFLLVVGVGIIILVLSYQKRQLQYLREKEELKNAYDKGILESRLEIQEQTLRTLAQELHDNIGQMLSVAKFNLHTMDLSKPGILQVKISDTQEIIGQAIQDLRDLSKTMHPDYINDIGLLAAIEKEVAMVQRMEVWEVALDIGGDFFRLQSQQELLLFRIFQEALHNIIKHAAATRIHIIIQANQDNFCMCIKDNGKGFDVSVQHQIGAGLGIRNICNRAALIGATCNLESDPGNGTSIRIDLPRKMPEPYREKESVA